MYIINNKILATAALVSLIGCSENTNVIDTNPTDSTKTDIAAQPSDLPVYSVAMNSSYPPFEFSDGKGGFDGFDVDLLNAVAERGEFAVKYNPYNASDFDRIIESVADGTEDMSASSIFITPERQENFGFSNPYFTMPVYFVGIDTPDRPTSVDDIKDMKISIDTENFLLKNIIENSFLDNNNEALISDSTYLAFKSMIMGESDVMLENIMTIDDYSQLINHTDLYYLQLPDEYSIQLGYLTKKDDQELLNKLNKGIKAVQADGTYDEIYEKWFGELEAKIEARDHANHNHPVEEPLDAE